MTENPDAALARAKAHHELGRLEAVLDDVAADLSRVNLATGRLGDAAAAALADRLAKARRLVGGARAYLGEAGRILLAPSVGG